MPNSQIQLSYQVCPIILTGGIAAQIPGGMLPMLHLFSSVGGNSLALPFEMNDLDDAFGAFNVLPGGTLVSQQIAKYPFANQDVAANAVIREPLTLSVIMDAPMRGPNAWQVKQIVMSMLKATLESHNNSGGTYTVATPAWLYTNLVMLSLTDNSRGNNSLPQNAWRFDFERPLVALAELQGSQSSLMGKLSNQTPTSGTQTGIQPGQTSGQSPLSEMNIPLPLPNIAAPQLSSLAQAAGTLFGGTPPVINSALGSFTANFPAIASMAQFPFNGFG
jgi:hypothetical protein